MTGVQCEIEVLGKKSKSVGYGMIRNFIFVLREIEASKNF